MDENKPMRSSIANISNDVGEKYSLDEKLPFLIAFAEMLDATIYEGATVPHAITRFSWSWAVSEFPAVITIHDGAGGMITKAGRNFLEALMDATLAFNEIADTPRERAAKLLLQHDLPLSLLKD